jgi:YD repeat-containing protein
MNYLVKLLFSKSIVLLLVLSFIVFISCGNSKTESKEVQDKKTVKKEKLKEQSEKELSKAKNSFVKVRKKYAAIYLPNGVLPAEKTLVEELYFDEKGLRTELMRYRNSGLVDLIYLFEHDSLGHLTMMETQNASGQILNRTEFKYDSKGNEIEKIINDGKKTGELKTTTKYDESNNPIEVTTFDLRGNLFSSQVLEYKNDILIKSVTKSSQGIIVLESVFEYDENGNLIKELRKEQNNELVFIYKYDEMGRLIEALSPETKRVYDYNSNGDLVEDKLFFSDGSRQFRVTFNYTKNGLMNEEIRYSNDETPAFYSKYEYEFNK